MTCVELWTLGERLRSFIMIVALFLCVQNVTDLSHGISDILNQNENKLISLLKQAF